MRRILTKFLARFNQDSLASLIKDASLRQSIIGVDRRPYPTEKEQEQNAARIVNYARSEDYAIYAEELWRTMTFYLNELCRKDLKDTERAFYSGCLSATRDDLKISYNALHFLNSAKEKPPVLNGHRRDSPTPGRN